MRAFYVGARQSHELLGRKTRNNRWVELNYEDHERDLFFLTTDLMESRGWTIDTGVMNWGSCLVADREEFNAFMEDWKECKKEARNIK